MENLEKFNRYCKLKGIKCHAHPVGYEKANIYAPGGVSTFTLDAFKYIDDILLTLENQIK